MKKLLLILLLALMPIVYGASCSDLERRMDRMERSIYSNMWEIHDRLDDCDCASSSNTYKTTYFDAYGTGMNARSLGVHFIGDNTFFNQYITMIDYISEYYALKTEIDELKARIILGNNATDEQVMLKAAMIRADRTNKTQMYGNYSCVPYTPFCVKLG